MFFFSLIKKLVFLEIKENYKSPISKQKPSMRINTLRTILFFTFLFVSLFFKSKESVASPLPPPLATFVVMKGKGKSEGEGSSYSKKEGEASSKMQLEKSALLSNKKEEDVDLPKLIMIPGVLESTTMTVNPIVPEERIIWNNNFKKEIGKLVTLSQEEVKKKTHLTTRFISKSYDTLELQELKKENFFGLVPTFEGSTMLFYVGLHSSREGVSVDADGKPLAKNHACMCEQCVGKLIKSTNRSIYYIPNKDGGVAVPKTKIFFGPDTSAFDGFDEVLFPDGSFSSLHWDLTSDFSAESARSKQMSESEFSQLKSFKNQKTSKTKKNELITFILVFI